MSRDRGMGMGGKNRGGGRDPSAQFGGGGRDANMGAGGKNLSTVGQYSRESMTAQRQRARGRISPSTTLQGKAIAQGIGALTGVPYFGGKLGARMVDYSPMAFGVPKSTRPKQTIMADEKGGARQSMQQPIAGPIAINQPIIPLAQRRKATVSPTGRFNYALKKGGMLIKGKPKLTKKGWK